MNISQKLLAENHSEVTIVIEPPDFKEDVEKTLRKYRKEAAIPGFRSGNIPMGVIVKRFGKDVLAAKLNELTSDALGKYISENKIELLGRPLLKSGFNTDEAFLDTNYSFVFELGLLPEHKPQFPENNQVLYHVNVDPAMAEKQIEGYRVRYGTVNEPSCAGEDDYVRIKYHEADEQGRKTVSAIQGNAFIKIGSVNFVELKNKFIGAKKNDEIMISVNPGNAAEVGKLMELSHDKISQVKHGLLLIITKIEHFEKAELNDSFYANLFSMYGVQSTEELHQAILNNLADMYRDHASEHFLHDALTRIAEQPGYDLPLNYMKNLYGYLTHTDPGTLEQDAGFTGFLKGMRIETIKKTLIRNFDIRLTEDELLTHAASSMEKRFPYFYKEEPPQEGKEPPMTKMEFYKNLARISFQKKEMEEEKEKMSNYLFEKKLAGKLIDAMAPERKDVSIEEFSKLSHNH